MLWPNTSFVTHLFDGVRQGIIFLPWIAAILLASTYLRATGVERQRLAWVIAGLLIGCLVEPVNDLAARIDTVDAGYVARSVGLLQLAVPILVGYGVMRHRILDVGFVLNRAAVYTALTTVLLGTMGLLRLTLGNYLKDNWAILLQVATAIGLGFSSQRIYKAADWVIDRYLFPDSHKNEVKLKRLGDGLRFAETADAIAASVTQEPAETLGLASAALFRKRNDGIVQVPSNSPSAGATTPSPSSARATRCPSISKAMHRSSTFATCLRRAPGSRPATPRRITPTR